jgi:hypothetical protein
VTHPSVGVPRLGEGEYAACHDEMESNWSGPKAGHALKDTLRSSLVPSLVGQPINSLAKSTKSAKENKRVLLCGVGGLCERSSLTVTALNRAARQ